MLDKLLRHYVTSDRLRAACVLLCIWVEHVLYEVNNYMPDLLALPLLFWATSLVLDERFWQGRRREVVFIAILLGISVALKLSNAAVAAPVVVLCVWHGFRSRPFSRLVLDGAASIVAFAAPLVPFTIWVYRLTGSPAFPLYNGIFKSPFYPLSNGWDGRWGGFGAPEILSWPVVMFFQPGRTAELHQYSGRLSVAFIVALICVPFARWIGRRMQALVFILLLGSGLWSLTMGYIRYGLYLEVLSGVLLVGVTALVLRTAASHHIAFWRVILAALLTAVMVAQATVATKYFRRDEWGSRLTGLDDPSGYLRESKYLARDRSVRALLGPYEREVFDHVDVWVVSGYKTSGVMLMLNDRAPFIGARSAGIYLMEPSRAKLAETLDAYAGKRLWSMAHPPDYADALYSLRSVGLDAGQIFSVDVPFYSPTYIFRMYLFEVVRPANAANTPPKRSEFSQALTRDDLRATLLASDFPPKARNNDAITLSVTVINSGTTIWPSLPLDPQFRIVIRARWLSADGKEAKVEPERAGLPFDLRPGESVSLPLDIRAPAGPGDYVLEVGIGQEGLAFEGRGDLRLKVKVER